MERLSGDRPDADRREALVVSAAVGLHLVTAVAHGVVHEAIPVHLPAWGNAIVAVAVFLGPLAGVRCWRRG